MSNDFKQKQLLFQQGLKNQNNDFIKKNSVSEISNKASLKDNNNSNVNESTSGIVKRSSKLFDNPFLKQIQENINNQNKDKSNPNSRKDSMASASVKEKKEIKIEEKNNEKKTR